MNWCLHYNILISYVYFFQNLISQFTMENLRQPVLFENRFINKSSRVVLEDVGELIGDDDYMHKE